MRSTTKSFANEFGISQKKIDTNPSMGIGLNPNLNIEDEYIQNMLKQVHFLNMEIKLIKEKQKQNKGMGIMGLLNKDQNPVVTHAVTSNARYTDMKTQLSQLVNTAEVDYIRLDDQNFAVKAQRDAVERSSLKEEQKNIENKLYVDKGLNQVREKLGQQLKKLKELREENRRINDNYSRVHHQWEDLKTKTKTKALMKDIAESLEGEATALRQKHAKLTEQKLKANQAKIQQADRLFNQDPNYKKLVEENLELKDKLKRTDKELFDLCYRVKEMQELKKTSLRNKDVENELKKQAIQESERLKKRVQDKKDDIEGKLKEAKANLQTNDEIRLLKGKLARKDKEINDLKKKTQVSQTNYKRLRDQVQKLQTNFIQRKQKNKQLQEKLNKLKVQQNLQTAKLRQAELDYEKSSSDMVNFQTMLKQARKRLQGLQEQLSYLAAKQDYLTREINIDQGLKKIKIEQLTNLVHSNSSLNDTIGNLLQKWDQIIKFTRQPPSSV